MKGQKYIANIYSVGSFNVKGETENGELSLISQESYRM